MSDISEIENNLAKVWYEGVYTQDQAKLSSELQGLDFNNVIHEYGRLYELEQRAGAEQWN